MFSKSRPEISSTDVVETLGMNQATAHRFLLTLEKTGAIRSTKRGYYALGEKIVELGQVYEESGAMTILIRPVLEALSRTLRESVMACRLSRTGPICVAVANSSQPISVNISVGTVLPFHTTAQGKLWLAEMEEAKKAKVLEHSIVAANTGKSYTDVKTTQTLSKELAQIRSDGFATNMGDNEPDIAAVSVPVRRSSGQMVLSLSAFGLLRRFDNDLIENAKTELRAAALRIGNKHWP